LGVAVGAGTVCSPAGVWVDSVVGDKAVSGRQADKERDKIKVERRTILSNNLRIISFLF
jgi:hypothetical protein